MNASVRMQKAYEEVGGKSALPWVDIIAIIMQLMGGCSAKSAKRFAKNHPIALEAMLQNKLKEDSGCIPKDVKLVAKAGVVAFNRASVAEVEAAM